MDEVDNGNARRVLTRSGGFGRSAEVNIGRVIMPLTLWDERDESVGEITNRIRQRTQGISGARVNANPAGSPIARNSTRPLAIAMGGGEYEEIVKWRDKVMQRVAAENPHILNLESDYLERQPRVIVQIDRNKAADLGVSLQTVGPHARNHAGFAHRHHVRARRRGIRRRPAGATRNSARASATSTIFTCAPTRTTT